MKLLLDQNLSPRLIRLLRDDFPETTHVSEVGMSDADDRRIWQYAREQGFLIVTRDSDFMELSTLLGAPPKVIWVRRGNCSTTEILDMFYSNLSAIGNLEHSETRILILR